MTPVPRWFAALLCAGAGGVAGAGLVGLVAAVAGSYDWTVALAAGIAGAGAGAALAWRVVPGGSGASGWAAAAVAVAALFVGTNWGFAGQTVVLERDPGLYTSTARWLDRDGGLLVDVDVAPFAGVDGVSYLSVGMYEHGATRLEFQGSHLTPVLLATGYGAGGPGGLQRVPLVLVAGGLLAVWALAARVTGRGDAALAVVVALAVSLPILGVARDTLSEPVVLLLLWTGLWLWTVAADSGRPAAALAAGVCLGTCVAARIDAAAFLVPVPIVLALHGRRAGWRPVAALAAGLVPGVAVAALDIGLRSRGYVKDLDVEVGLLYALLAAATVAGLAVARWRRPPLRVPGDALAALVVGALVLAWFVRPHVQTVLARDSDLVRALQAAQGDAIDGRRRYHELSMVWQSWYLGAPLLAAAVAGAGIVVRRLAAGVDRALLLPLSALGASTALYLYRPAISPDHLWASRRFVPAALPLWCVLAAVAVVAVVAVLPRARLVRAATGVAAAGLAIVPIVIGTWPVREFHEFDGFLGLVERVCDTVGPDAAVVLPAESRAGTSFTQSIRSWCGVPAALVEPGTEVTGPDVWLVSDPAAGVAGSASAVTTITVTAERRLERTLTSAPDEYESWTETLLLTLLVPAGRG